MVEQKGQRLNSKTEEEIAREAADEIVNKVFDFVSAYRGTNKALCKAIILSAIQSAGESEKVSRIYYQDIVYAVCVALDRMLGRSVIRGTGIVCGTSTKPSNGVQDELNAIADKLTSLQRENEQMKSQINSCTEEFDECHRALFGFSGNKVILKDKIEVVTKELSSLRAENERQLGKLIDANALLAESRNQCAALRAEVEKKNKALQEIVDLDPGKDFDQGFNEWGEAECFNKAQAIAQSSLTNQEGEGR